MASTPAILSGGGGLDISIGPIAVLANVVLIEWLLGHGGVGSAWVGDPDRGPARRRHRRAQRRPGGRLPLPVGHRHAVHVLRAGRRDRQDRAGSEDRAGRQRGSPASATRSGPSRAALLLVAAPLVVWWLLSRTAFHRNLYAVGGNDATAFSAGIDVTAVRVTRLQPRRGLRRGRRRRADGARAARRRRPGSRSTR